MYTCRWPCARQGKAQFPPCVTSQRPDILHAARSVEEQQITFPPFRPDNNPFSSPPPSLAPRTTQGLLSRVTLNSAT
ncbi:hypothetical protein VDGE_30445 [Verticillium dahliae]|uniref:Uncharacterized protein n=1 Tax=Verticillium dahliae TaxID=27337 RepID=A0A444S1D7_VERDA|nr:hypothetical protein VDGE_30445 [Verticillium dahliae]